MGYYEVVGGTPLCGNTTVHGSKNAVLPILAACILAEDEVILEHCPKIADVNKTLLLLQEMGCSVKWEGHTLVINSRQAGTPILCCDAVRQMRSSVLFLGALLARYKKASVGLPGGCSIGARPIDLHLRAFEKMGVVVEKTKDCVHCRAKHILGYHIYLDFPSVGATENLLLLAVKAEGVTVIHNAAKEPEVVALASFLRACGAEVYGEGTSDIMIEGVKRLHGAVFSLPADRIESGTLLCASAITAGEIFLERANAEELQMPLYALEQVGCKLFREKNGIALQAPKRLKGGLHLETGPYPAFPTDLQPIFMSLLTLANGTCMISETVFEARLSHAAELCRMGADIRIHGNCAHIFGREKLCGTAVRGKDLRATAALLLAAFAAEGESRVYGSTYLERGYENPERLFSLLGGRISLKEEQTEEYGKTQEKQAEYDADRSGGGSGVLLQK